LIGRGLFVASTGAIPVARAHAKGTRDDRVVATAYGRLRGKLGDLCGALFLLPAFAVHDVCELGTAGCGGGLPLKLGDLGLAAA